MSISNEIQNITIDNEFQVCPSCGYTRGFHVSFLQSEEKGKYKILLICPSCGSRFKIGWTASLKVNNE